MGLLLTPITPNVWSCPSLAAGTICAVEPNAFVSAFGPEPRISASIEATVHFESTTPLPIGSTGTPNVVAAPTLNAFQQDLIIIRAITGCTVS